MDPEKQHTKNIHEEHSRSGMALASHIWIAGDYRNAHGHVMPFTNDDDVDASLVAARASQRKETTRPHRYEIGQISTDTSCSVRDIKN